MIKVRVTRAGVIGASGLVALSGVAACAADQGEDVGESSESGLTVSNPGTGVFELTWTYGTPTGYSFTATKSSTDEYVRAGEKMTFAIPAFFLWSRLYPNDPLPNDVARLQKLAVKAKAVNVRGGAAYSSSKVTSTGWQGTQTWDLAATTSSFTVAKKAEGIRFELEITDAANPAAKASVAQTDLLEVPVIGGTLPNKTLLFDNMGSTLRSRVLEGGNPVAGATLALAYTDWRAATLVDASTIDRTIGSMTSFGRFGAFEMPIQGELEYEVTCAVAIDGAWQADQALAANAASRLMPPSGRVAYEGSVAIAAGAKKLEIYFHVKTFLKVDYSKYQNIKWQKYAPGDRILVREKWDNENGVAFDNWDFVTEKK
jgi:hypothetical protein